MSETIIDGIRCYAPEFALQNENFPPHRFNALYNAEQKHFWFRSRNRILKSIVLKFKPANATSFLEIGCGTGYVLNGMHERFPKMKLTGSEIYVSGLKCARERLPSAEFIQMDATRMPFSNEFDLIGAFDVLEHIDEDEKVMLECSRTLRPGGLFVITVPQHMWMWSSIDDFSFHKRRYSRKELRTKLEAAGFEVVRTTSFVFSLLPIMYLSRLRRKNVSQEKLTEQQVDSELFINPVLNFLLGTAMRVDELLISIGLSLPWGGSLLIVAKKK